MYIIRIYTELLCSECTLLLVLLLLLSSTPYCPLIELCVPVRSGKTLPVYVYYVLSLYMYIICIIQIYIFYHPTSMSSPSLNRLATSQRDATGRDDSGARLWGNLYAWRGARFCSRPQTPSTTARSSLDAVKKTRRKSDGTHLTSTDDYMIYWYVEIVCA